MNESIVSAKTIENATVIPANQSIINWEYLHQVCDGNEEFEIELLHTFVEDTEKYLPDIEQAIATQNFYLLEQRAHHLKGSSGNTGITQIYETACELEIQARERQIDGAPQRLSVLQTSLQAVREVLASRS
jgi:HPt (histidine-containing phosphotransfer) domain-containing protein